jgi:hypothetical protein
LMIERQGEGKLVLLYSGSKRFATLRSHRPNRLN